jgi:hypothetical protein
MDTTASWWISWLDNPQIALGFGHFQLLIVCMEIMKFVRQNIRIRNKVKLISAEPFLHFYVVITQSVLACDFVTLREMIHALELIESFVKVTLAGACRPKNIPFMRLSVSKAVCLQKRSH